MFSYWVFFCDIICQFFPSLLPEYVEMILSYSVLYPIKYHIYCSGYFCFSVPFTMIFDGVLSVDTGVGGCEFPISYGAVCSIISLSLLFFIYIARISLKSYTYIMYMYLFPLLDVMGKRLHRSE